VGDVGDVGDVEGVEVNRPTIIVFLPFLDGLVDARWFLLYSVSRTVRTFI
jgi:hypothetical protein